MDNFEHLAESILKARKVMQKVESGDYSKSNNPTTNQVPNNTKPQPLVQEQMLSKKNNIMRNIKNSKMPEAILKSFEENPIVDPTMPIGMDMMESLAKKIGEQQGAFKQEVVNQTTEAPSGNQDGAQMIDMKLLEFIIKKTVEETLNEVSKKTELDENIQIKIGDKTFGGKIKTLKEIK